MTLLPREFCRLKGITLTCSSSYANGGSPNAKLLPYSMDHGFLITLERINSRCRIWKLSDEYKKSVILIPMEVMVQIQILIQSS